jgi:hypothetical protein
LGELAEFIVDSLIISRHYFLQSNCWSVLETITLSKSADLAFLENRLSSSTCGRDTFGKFAFYLIECAVFDVFVVADARGLHATDVLEEVSREDTFETMLDPKLMCWIVFDYLYAFALFYVVK